VGGCTSQSLRPDSLKNFLNFLVDSYPKKADKEKGSLEPPKRKPSLKKSREEEITIFSFLLSLHQASN